MGKGGDGVEQRELVERLLRRDETGMEELLRHYGPLMKYVIPPSCRIPGIGRTACPKRPCGCGSGSDSLTGSGGAGPPGSPP